ncbi:hypothetical protein BgiMline_018880 [Biomphalaria glabrata]|uniref:UPAR/Ly6 domain-containing protein n=1 Tax=Biomphalaria glabrata TaxID=6526 RepID=A0A2C9L6R7_BIOGL|nr:hypothetical protein BgiBS90_033168 [Biomphalaria glabrata]KAI8763532.1 hypothetical protein BgiMline_006468 [Biomphalaria glabrata]
MTPYAIFIHISLTFFITVNGQITCPVCTDPYNPDSCTGTQQCHSHDVCELHVHLSDRNRVNYICHNSHACVNQQTHACNPYTHDTCTFCCNSLQSCATERQDLFTTRFTAAMSTLQPTSFVPTAAPTINATTASMCIRCDSNPCNESLIPSLQPIQCPSTQPYCYTDVVQDAAGRSVYKGCANENFCRTKYWDYSAVSVACSRYPYSSSAYLECTFCCLGEGCNRADRPPQYTLVNF